MCEKVICELPPALLITAALFIAFCQDCVTHTGQYFT